MGLGLPWRAMRGALPKAIEFLWNKVPILQSRLFPRLLQEDRERRRRELEERRNRLWEVSKKILEDKKV